MKKAGIYQKLLFIIGAAVLLQAETVFAGQPAKYIDVSAGSLHTLAIREDHSLWAWGHNTSGTLGIGTDGGNQASPVKIMDHVVSCYAGQTSSMALQEDGSLWIFGGSADGDGYLPDGSAFLVPRKVMDGVVSVSCDLASYYAVKQDGSLWAWGYNSSAELGNGGQGTDYGDGNLILIWQREPVQIMDGVKKVSAGDGYALALQEDGSLWGWGSFCAGVGVGADPSRSVYNSDPWYDPNDYRDFIYPVKVMDNVRDLSVGNGATYVVKEDGSLWAWGTNTDGNLGIGEVTPRFSDEGMLSYRLNGQTKNSIHSGQRSKAVKVMDSVALVSAGKPGGLPNPMNACAVKEDGSLWVWGAAYYGQLGNGSVTGNAVNEDGLAVQTVPVKVMDGVSKASAGGGYIMALKTDGTLWGWGTNHVGQLGSTASNGVNGNWAIQTVPVQIP